MAHYYARNFRVQCRKYAQLDVQLDFVPLLKSAVFTYKYCEVQGMKACHVCYCQEIVLIARRFREMMLFSIMNGDMIGQIVLFRDFRSTGWGDSTCRGGDRTDVSTRIERNVQRQSCQVPCYAYRPISADDDELHGFCWPLRRPQQQSQFMYLKLYQSIN